MGGKLPKVLTPAEGRPLLAHVLRAVAGVSPDRSVIVTGFAREQVEEVASLAGREHDLGDLRFAFQEHQHGTGDAVRIAVAQLTDFRGTVLIVYGDMPLIQSSTLRALLDTHATENATLSITSVLGSPASTFGRVVRDADGRVQAICEYRDCSPVERRNSELNVGIYAVDSAFLVPAVESLAPHNAQNELYLTDIVGKASKEGQALSSHFLQDASEAMGVNTPSDLLAVDVALRKRTVERALMRGVRFSDPSTVYIGPEVTIEAGAYIGPNVMLQGRTIVSKDACIEGSSMLNDTIVADGAWVRFGVVADGTTIGEGAQIGPFAHLRAGTELSHGVKIGNFVETKKTIVGAHSKASHLSYLGDCVVGSNVNIGAGTITCNYDGYEKFTTAIEDGAFIGSNAALVAPVTIGKGATIGAGSTITRDVTNDSLAVTRADQKEVPMWSKRKRAQAELKKKR